MKILITGASGALGPEVLRQLAERHPDSELLILSHKTPLPPEGARELGDGPKIVHARWDLLAPDLGNPLFGELLRDVTHVVHLAADVRWNQELAPALAMNCTA